MMTFCFPCCHCRVVKLGGAHIQDFETLYVQVQEFMSSCNEHMIKYAPETCKLTGYETLLGG